MECGTVTVEKGEEDVSMTTERSDLETEEHNLANSGQVSMYVCMYVYVYMYVCMYARMYVCMYVAVCKCTTVKSLNHFTSSD